MGLIRKRHIVFVYFCKINTNLITGIRKLVTVLAERVIPLSSRRLYPSARFVFSEIFHNLTVLSNKEKVNNQELLLRNMVSYHLLKEENVQHFFV